MRQLDFLQLSESEHRKPKNHQQTQILVNVVNLLHPVDVLAFSQMSFDVRGNVFVFSPIVPSSLG